MRIEGGITTGIKKQKTKLALLLLTPIILLSLFSCNGNETYFAYKELKDEKWAISQPLTFEIDSSRIKLGAFYDISIEITNSFLYPYQNLWVAYEYINNDSLKVEKKQELILADKSGKWLGFGFGSLFQSSHLLESSILIPKDRKYKILIYHAMNDSTLIGIEKVGIKITHN